MKNLNILNEVASKGRLKGITLSVYLINEVSPRSFLREEVLVSEDTKIVQARALFGVVNGMEGNAEGVYYVSVPKDLKVGTFVHLTGDLSAVSTDEYSRGLGLFRFRKDRGSWVICSNSLTLWASMGEVYTDNQIKENLTYWENYPYTLSVGDSVITPMTRMFATEVRYSLYDKDPVSDVEFEKVTLTSPSYKLTELQLDVLSEMLVLPTFQLQVENEEVFSVEALVSQLKGELPRQVLVYDIRDKGYLPSAVLARLKGAGRFDGSTQVILLVDKVEDGVPSLQLGHKCLR